MSFMESHGKEEIVETLLPIVMLYKNQRDRYNDKYLSLRLKALDVLSKMKENPDKIPELIDELEKTIIGI